LWLHDYVRGIAPTIPAGQTLTVNDIHAPVGAVQAEDWASRINRTNLRTFTWRISGGDPDGRFAIAPATGQLSLAKPQLLDELTTYTLKVRVSDGFHESAETEVAVKTGDLPNVADGAAGGAVPATLSLSLGAAATFGAFTPGLAKEYTASTTATVTSTAGDATLTASPTTLTNGTFSLAQPVTITPEKTSWSGPASNDAFAVAFKQSIGGTEALRTGAYTGTVTFTLSTTTP
jgi:hypothetical protein